MVNDSDIRGSMAAMRRAAARARRVAKATGTPLIIMHNGKIIELDVSGRARRAESRGLRNTPELAMTPLHAMAKLDNTQTIIVWSLVLICLIIAGLAVALQVKRKVTETGPENTAGRRIYLIGPAADGEGGNHHA